MFASIKRIFKSGWQSFFRDGGLAGATIFILFLAISLATFIFLFQGVSQFLISMVEEKADIAIYFKPEVPEGEILTIEEELKKNPIVKEVKYVSKEEALTEFSQKHEENSVLISSLEEVGNNPFLPSLHIMAFEGGQYETIAKLFEASMFENLVEKVDYYQRKPIIEKIFSLTSTIDKVSFFLLMILGAIAVLVTFNTIRLAIYNFKEEIEIQRLVGASNWFIRGPFLVQGAISGIAAVLICLSIFSLAIWWLNPKIETFLGGFDLWQFFQNNLGIIILIQFATGTLLGIISSSLAIKKYLKI